MSQKLHCKGFQMLSVFCHRLFLSPPSNKTCCTCCTSLRQYLLHCLPLLHFVTHGDDIAAQLKEPSTPLIHPDVSRELPYVHYHELGLGRVLHPGRYAVVCEGIWGNSPAIFKVLMSDGWQPADLLVHETVMYRHMQPLQGGKLPMACSSYFQDFIDCNAMTTERSRSTV